MTSRVADQHSNVTIDLSAVVVAVSDDEPRVLTVGGGEALPFGAFVSGHRTLELGLRAWVADQTGLSLGYVEQLYTFADLDRAEGTRAVSVSYLALVRAGKLAPASDAAWQGWYRYFPWEDWRHGPPAVLDEVIRPRLDSWVAAASGAEARQGRAERSQIAFGQGSAGWSDERVLERFELLYEAGLVAEAQRRASKAASEPATGRPMHQDHRRMLATAIARLRGKIKYRPVVFELMPPTFTLLKLQRAVEGLAGTRLHKQNFRRLIAQQGLVEETGLVETDTGGRPAKQVRFRREVLRERPAPGVRLPGAGRAGARSGTR